MTISKNKRSAFTYIELLIVVVIILAVSTVSVVAWKSATVKARDTKRKSDLQQYHIALQNYGSQSSWIYPTVTQNSLADTLCVAPNTLKSSKYLTVCPQDHKNSFDISYGYYYSTSTSSSNRVYVLYTKLESKDVYWVYCSNGKSGEVRASAVISLGVCPLP